MVGLEGGIAGVDVRMRWAWDGCLEGGIYAESGRVLGGPILGAFSSRVVNTLWGFDGGLCRVGVIIITILQYSL